MTTLTLSVDKSVAKGNETVKFTASYPGEANKEIVLVEKITGSDPAVGRGMTDSNGIAVIEWKGATQGLHTFYAVHSIIPGISICGIWCDQSNEVSVSITEAPCDPWDIVCRISPGIDTKLIAAVLVFVIVVYFLFMYFPKKR